MTGKTTQLAGLLVLVSSLAYGEADFDNTLNIGLTITEGNSETVLGNVAFVSEGEFTTGNSLRLALEGNYGESKIDDRTETTVENIRGSAKYQHDLSKRWYAAANTSALYDDIAEIDYRAILGPAIGGYLVRQDNLRITAELGPSYVWEKVSRERDNYLAVRIAERLDYRISETARIWQSAEFLPQTEDFEDFLLNAELGASADMTSRMQLRVVLQLSHDSTPGPDLEKNDFTLISGLGIQI